MALKTIKAKILENAESEKRKLKKINFRINRKMALNAKIHKENSEKRKTSNPLIQSKKSSNRMNFLFRIEFEVKMRSVKKKIGSIKFYKIHKTQKEEISFINLEQEKKI